MSSQRLATTRPARTDAELARRVRRGETAAFDELHRRYRLPLLRYAERRLGAHGAAAEDVVQEAFVRAHRAMSDPLGDVRPGPWLYRVVHNRCIDELRRPAATADPDLLARALAPARDDTDAAVLRGDRLAEVVADVVALPSRQREALVAHAVDGEPHARIAARLGTTEAASKRLVVRARHALQGAEAARREAAAIAVAA